MTIRQFITTHRIRMTCERADRNPNMVNMTKDDQDWNRWASHYQCRFTHGRRRFTTYFSMGPAHTQEPKASEVLDCLALDAATIENSKSFEDWCAELGYDTDSRSAERMYQVCVRQAEQLERFLGAELYRELFWETEHE